ncbi:MAG: YggS family pyridoxal phosphate-dependent enzyme [Candidatus Omnitrophota bacterium]
MNLADVRQNAENILKELPAHVQLVAAAKARTSDEIRAVIEAGVRIIGHNYVQEAARTMDAIAPDARCHFIGHLQKNKVRKAVTLFDLIETVDSIGLAEEIDERCAGINRVMPVLIEINSARETRKSGVFPEDAYALAEAMAAFPHIKVMGLMTMGPVSGSPGETRAAFAETRKAFDYIKAKAIPGVEMKYLSMGMTGSYGIAIEEGANIVRIGTKIFGERE